MAHLANCPAGRTSQAACTSSRSTFRAAHLASFVHRHTQPCRSVRAVAAQASTESHRQLPARLQQVAAAAALAFALQFGCGSAQAATLPEATDVKVLCDKACESDLDSAQEQSTKSGLRYKDIKVGEGATPPVGYQITVDYVAMTPQGKIFDNSLEKGKPYDVRLGSGQIVAGLDEGIKGMKAGGVRRVYVPGNLSFPKGVASAPGRPRVPPSSPVVFDVKLLYIPGLSDDELVLE